MPKITVLPSTIGRWGVLVGALFLVLALLPQTIAETETKVDLVLVVALDVSGSVDGDEFLLQRDGLAEAFSSPQILHVIRQGENKQIAVSVIQWSGFTEQVIKIGWTVLASQEDIDAFSSALSSMTRRYDEGATDIGGALQFTWEQAIAAPYTSPRRVVDIVGDGTNNVNVSPTLIRDDMISAGVDINALAVSTDGPPLTAYYRENVIGGAGSFVETAIGYDDFERAIKRKLLREIKGPSLMF